MDIRKTPVQLGAKINTFLFKYWRLKGRSIAEYYTGIDKIYLASADQYAGLAFIADAPEVLQCEHFYSVIGGMGGLSILARQADLKTITFYDVNPQARYCCDIHLKLIQAADSRNEFISLVYARPFTATYHYENQHEFYALPLQDEFRAKAEKILGQALYPIFRQLYDPYIINPLRDIYTGITQHVTRLPVFHEADVTGVMTYPFYSRLEQRLRGMSSVNSFFMGKGWLASEQRFQQVKKHLHLI
jgi:hypothetical protein